MRYHLISGTVWLLCGIAICYLGFLIGVRGRVDLHQDYDGSVDPVHAARWVGGTAILMGLVTVAYALREMYYGFDPLALGGLLATLLVLSYASKLFARGVLERS